MAGLSKAQKVKKERPVSVDYRVELYRRLRDPEYAALYLKGILEEGDPNVIWIGLSNVAAAYDVQPELFMEALDRYRSEAGRIAEQATNEAIGLLKQKLGPAKHPQRKGARSSGVSSPTAPRTNSTRAKVLKPSK